MSWDPDQPSQRGEHGDDVACRRSPGLLVREVGDEVVILDPGRDQVHQLNATASLIWTLFDQGLRSHEVVRELTTRFDITDDRAYEDVKRTVSDFRRLRLLTEAGQGRR